MLALANYGLWFAILPYPCYKLEAFSSASVPKPYEWHPNFIGSEAISIEIPISLGLNQWRNSIYSWFPRFLRYFVGQNTPFFSGSEAEYPLSDFLKFLHSLRKFFFPKSESPTFPPRQISSSHILRVFLAISVFRPPRPPRITGTFFRQNKCPITSVTSFLTEYHCRGARGKCRWFWFWKKKIAKRMKKFEKIGKGVFCFAAAKNQRKKSY